MGSLIFLFWFGLGFLPLHGPGYPETRDVDQANLKLTEIHLLLPQCWIKGVHHHAQHLLDVLMFCSSYPKASLPGKDYRGIPGSPWKSLHKLVLFCFLSFFV